MGTLLDLPLSATTLRPRDENLTEGLVDDTPLKTVNPLAKRDYIKVGCNEQFSVRPAIVHFGGYDVKSVHRTTVRVTNTTSHSKRIVILPPNTPFFKATCNKKGLVAPGMSEDIRLEFCPTEWRYYYDCIRVHSESENLIVPIHAYPVMNDVIFPVRIDFGNCAADQLYTKKVKLECKVPIQFEFDIRPLTPGGASLAAVSVAPASGFVPADGAVEVEVSFRPLRLVTYVEQFLVTVSQFNSEPLTCTVTGCATPCKVRDDALAGLAAGARGTQRCGEAGATMQELAGVTGPPAFRPGAGNAVGAPGGGAGRGDAYTRAAQATMKAVRAAQRPEGPIQCKMPEFPAAEEEVAVRGVMVQPGALHTQAGVQAALLQQDGKLRMKDLQKAIDDNHRRRQRQQESVESGASQGLGWIEDEDMSQQIKEMIFAKEFSALVDYEREVELKFGRALGGVPPSEAEVQDVEVARHYADTKQEATSKLSNQRRYHPELGPGRGAHFAGVDPIPGFSPDYDIYKNRDFERRRQVVDRLRLAVRRVLVRNRAGARLAALNRLLNSLHRDKAKVQAACNEATLGGASAGAGDVVYQQPPWNQDKVREHVFPLHLDSNFRDRAPVEEAPTLPNEVWLPMPLKVPLRYKLQSYTEMPFSPFPVYPETRQHQPLMQGAEEEEEAEETSGAVSSSLPPSVAAPQANKVADLMADLMVDPAPAVAGSTAAAPAPAQAAPAVDLLGDLLGLDTTPAAQGPGPSHVPAAASDPFALMSMDMSGAQPSPSAPLKRVMLAASAAQGLEISGMIVKSGPTGLAYDLTFNNGSAESLDGFQIQFNKNSFGLTPSESLQIPAMAPGSIATTVLPLAMNGQPSPMAATPSIQIAVKNRQQPVWYFMDTVPIQELFLLDNSLDRDAYLATWKSIPEETNRQYNGLTIMNVDEIVAKIQPHGVFFMAQRQLPQTNQTVLYLSLKLPPSTLVLVELTFVLGVPGAKCCVKTGAPEVAQPVMTALELMMI
mmetsp:Transcript_9584/g.18058  ORF Transcript_9584/g.18058 Transcript_9584/m.18058 type:complete len:1002 (+) Transcript_9584:336-3341(+)